MIMLAYCLYIMTYLYYGSAYICIIIARRRRSIEEEAFHVIVTWCSRKDHIPRRIRIRSRPNMIKLKAIIFIPYI